VRCAAMRAVESIAGSPFIMADKQPTELQIRIVKAIVDRVVSVPNPEDDPWLHPDLEGTAGESSVATINARCVMINARCVEHTSHGAREKGEEAGPGAGKELSDDEKAGNMQFQMEVGIRLSLLFQLGCMEFSGWQSIEHTQWSHLDEWVHDQWRRVCDEKTVAKRLLAEHERAIGNSYTQRILAEMKMQHDDSVLVHEDAGKEGIAAMHIAALKRAAQQAATHMQAHWRGIKGRSAARREKSDMFERVQSAEFDRLAEEQREAQMTKVAKLLAYIDLRDKCGATNHSNACNDFILPHPQGFEMHRDSRRPSRCSSRQQSRTATPDSVPPAGGKASFHLRMSISNREMELAGSDQERDKAIENGFSKVVAGSFRTILPMLPDLVSPMQNGNAERAHEGWDPLGRKRSLSPPKKTLKEKEEEACRKFFEWEKHEKRRKDAQESVRKEQQKHAHRRSLKMIRLERPSPQTKKASGPVKLKATWKCGGVKISDAVKKIYSGDLPVGLSVGNFPVESGSVYVSMRIGVRVHVYCWAGNDMFSFGSCTPSDSNDPLPLPLSLFLAHTLSRSHTLSLSLALLLSRLLSLLLSRSLSLSLSLPLFLSRARALSLSLIITLVFPLYFSLSPSSPPSPTPISRSLSQHTHARARLRAYARANTHTHTHTQAHTHTHTHTYIHTLLVCVC